MAEVGATVDYITIESDSGRDIDSVEVTCKKCDHSTQSYGDGAASVRRCLLMLREECPRQEQNWYVADGGEDEC